MFVNSARVASMPRWFIAVVLLAIATAFAYWYFVLMAPFAKRDADAKIAFTPLIQLKPLILDNAFGVYHVEFWPDSKLTDENVSRILSLNQLPAEYDLTLWLKTPAVTDASIPVLAQLTTTDAIVIDGAGLTPAGLKRLSAANPKLGLFSPDGKRIIH